MIFRSKLINFGHERRFWMGSKALQVQTADYVKGKTWYWYLPGWVFGLYFFVKLLDFELGGQMSFVVAVPHSFNFILHETAHLLTGFLPGILTAAAGSFSELLLGALLIWGAFKGRTYFASLFCFLWFMLACQSAGDYMADARAQQLPLVSLGDLTGGTAVHDWNFVFGKLGILELDTFIGGTIRATGILAGLIGIVFSAWLMYKMAGASKVKALNQKEAELLHQSAAAHLAAPAPPKHFENLKEGSIYPTATKGRLAEEPAKQKSPKI
jgi:hypothetical protein